MSKKYTATKIYLSYAYVDNQNFEDEHRAWISAFKDDLELELSFLVGQVMPITIFHNKQFEGPNMLTVKYVNATDFFILVGTPAYYYSDFCQKELKLFLKRQDVNPVERIFLVDKKPFEDTFWQNDLEERNCYAFYDLETHEEWARKEEAEKYFEQIKLLAGRFLELL